MKVESKQVCFSADPQGEPEERNGDRVLIEQRQTTHAHQTTLTITSNHAQATPVRRALEAVSQVLQRFGQTAERFTLDQRWRQLLQFIFRDWLKTRPPDTAFLPLTAIADCQT